MKRPVKFQIRFFSSSILNHLCTPIILVVLLLIVTSACNSSGVKSQTTPGNPSDTAVPPGSSSASSQPDDLDKAMTLDQALAIPQDDNRPQVLEQMGPPDVFLINFQELNGKPVREEEWSYLDDQTRFDFINGALISTINLGPVPDLAVNASTYSPLSFVAGMTVEEVSALLKDQQFLQVDLADYGVTGGLILAGNQILLGFDGGKLVSVRTLELVQGVGQ